MDEGEMKHLVATDMVDNIIHEGEPKHLLTTCMVDNIMDEGESKQLSAIGMVDNIMDEGELKHFLTTGMVDNIMDEGELKHLLTTCMVENTMDEGELKHLLTTAEFPESEGSWNTSWKNMCNERPNKVACTFAQECNNNTLLNQAKLARKKANFMCSNGGKKSKTPQCHVNTDMIVYLGVPIAKTPQVSRQHGYDCLPGCSLEISSLP
ncbi:hypothetical protein RRG08_051794 [Elysia crispata]|uniref:Uncharacterized protein n=1 Tax=Elysia crispata TaxID=231223 RepID=A0AAE1A2E0_9GAST|nr:hypothetical protein RRG08_051794 [Elysia crispata]